MHVDERREIKHSGKKGKKQLQGALSGELKLKIEQRPLHSSSNRRQDCPDGGSDHYKPVSFQGNTESWTSISNMHTSSGIRTADLEFERR